MKITDTIKEKPIVGWTIFGAVMAAVFLLGLLAASVTERRAEIASIYNNKKVELPAGIEPKSALFGQNYPREYETWLKTANMDFESKHLGNKAQDVLEERPYMVILWAGYAFSRDYSAPRGHQYVLVDMRGTLRTGAPGVGDNKDMQPGTCWTCKSPDVPRVMAEKGIAEYYKAPWSQWGDQIVNPLGCADCHDPQTMELTITRPALIEAFERQGKDIKKASLQEMRTLVCAQCHVEYYFKGDGKYLTFPWDDGDTLEAMEAYYDKAGFTDFTHALSKTPIIKAQHPDYELFKKGTHGQRGLSCADCHMPYISEGGVKYSDHQWMSPLHDVSRSCQTCHRDSEEKLKSYVYEHQDKILELRDRVEPELAKAHLMAKAAWDLGATQDEMTGAQKLIRSAQWAWDISVASHGGSFHAPVEVQRIMSKALDKTMQAQLKLQKVLYDHGQTAEFEMPDLSTKEKAQAYLGLDMEKFRADKEEFLKTVVPGWIKSAEAAGRI